MTTLENLHIELNQAVKTMLSANYEYDPKLEARYQDLLYQIEEIELHTADN